MSTGTPTTVADIIDPLAWSALHQALRLDTAEEQLVEFICGRLEIAAEDTQKLLGQISPFVALCERLGSDYQDLAQLRVLETEYHRLIDESIRPGRIHLERISLWIIDTRTGKLSHDTGYLLDGARGGCYLLADGSSWTIKRGGEGYNEIVFKSAEDAADWLTQWATRRRKQLQESYAALEMLAQESAPAGTKRR